MIATKERQEEPLTFEKVWAALMETDRIVKENAEAIKETRESIKETRDSIKETQKETDRQMQENARSQKETGRQISRMGTRLGELIEHLTASNIVEKVNAEGYRFDHISRNHKIKDEQNKVVAEIDILLEDGDFAMVVEVKTNLTKTAVKEHLRRMDTLRRHADAHGDKRKYVCSVAGALIEDGAREYALEQGLYVIEHPGQTIEIVAPPKKREWQSAGEQR